MPGILDFLQTPEAQLGLGLFAAGGPSSTPMNVGQRVQMAMQGVDAQRQNALKTKLLESQIAENTSQDLLRRSQLERQARQDAYFLGNGFGSPSTGSSPSPATPSASVGATPTATASAPSAGGAVLKAAAGMAPNAPPPPQGKFAEWSKQFNIPVDALVADYLNNGGKGIADMLYKRGTPDMQVANGYAYDKNKLGAGFMPSFTTTPDGKSVITQIGPNGMPVVSVPQGAIDSFNAYQGAQANFKPMKVYNPATQREEYTTEGAVVGGSMPNAPTQRTGNPLIDAVIQTESGGNPNAVSPKGAQGLMQVMPSTNAAPGFGVAPAKDGSEAERTRVGQEYLTALNQKYQNPTLAAIAYNWGPGNTDMWLKSGGDFNKLPAETKNYVSAVMTRTAVNGFGQPAAQTQGAPAGNFAAGPSMQESARGKFNEKMATEQGDLLTKSYTSAQDASNALQGIQESRKAMQAGAFQGTGAEAKLAVAKFGQALGISIDPEKATNTDYLKSTLGNGLLEKAKTLGSNPSNADASRITDIVGSIGKDPGAMSKILDWQEEMARKAIDGHNTRVGQAEANGFKPQFDMRVKAPDGQATPKVAKVLDALPTPNTSNRGQRIRDTTTGQILVSNGLQWKPE